MKAVETREIKGYRGDTFKISVGDEVVLIYNGYPEVPHYLSNTPAFVEGFTKTKVKVRPTQYIGSKTIRQDQIFTVKK